MVDLHNFLDFALMTLNCIFFGEHLVVLFMKTCSLGSKSAIVLVDRNSNAQAAYEKPKRLRRSQANRAFHQNCILMTHAFVMKFVSVGSIVMENVANGSTGRGHLS